LYFDLVSEINTFIRVYLIFIRGTVSVCKRWIRGGVIRNDCSFVSGFHTTIERYLEINI